MMLKRLSFFVFGLSICMLLCEASFVDAQDRQRRQRGQDQGQGQGGRGRGGFGGFGGGFPGFGGRGGGGTQVMNPLSLLRIEEVQKELDMDEDQIKEVNDLAQAQRGGGPGQRGGDAGQRGGRPGQRGGDAGQRGGRPGQRGGDAGQRGGRPGQRGGDRERPSEEEIARFRAEFEKRQKEQAKEATEKLADILLPHQSDRLNELVIQRQGIMALLSDPVVAKLSISGDQKKKLSDTVSATREKLTAEMQKMRDSARDGGGGDFRAMFSQMREKSDTLNKRRDADMMAVLSDAQKQQFEEMKGEPFTFPERQFGGGGRGGRPGQGRGGQQGGRPQRPGRPGQNDN